MKEIMVGVVLLVATATPGFAQAYCACWGTGNVIDQPLLEKTNGAYECHVSPPAGRCSSICLLEPPHEA